MNFLAPLFLLGGAAIALPIVFHLIRRTTREKTIFSSLMFLLPSPPRLTRRSRLENILLLILRCAVLCLLALGFARPFISPSVSNVGPTGTSKRLAVLVDTSASMRRPDLWPDALAKAEAVIRETSPLDELGLFSFDRQLTPLLTFEQWNDAPTSERVAMAIDRLKAAAPGWGSTHLGNALIGAAEALADIPGKKTVDFRRIVLISDLQEGSHLDQLQGYEWPKGIELAVEPLKARRASNAGLQLVTEVDEGDSADASNVRVKVSNSPDSQREQFEIGWAASTNQVFVSAPIKIYVPAGQSRILPVPAPTATRTAERILLKGDDIEYDNSVFAIPPEKERLSVLYFGTETPQDSHQPLYFLQRAVQETRREKVQVTIHKPGTVLPPNEVQDAALILVTDSLSEAEAYALHQVIGSGKTMLFVLKNAGMAPSLARLLGTGNVRVTEANPGGYSMLAQIDFRHPIFAAFADPRFSDFTKIHFWKHRKVDSETLPQARTLAGFDNGDPALLEVPVAKGRVLVLTSSWHTEDSQLALSTKFVPLLYSLLEQNGATVFKPLQYFVGDVLPLSPPGDGQNEFTVRTPDGSELKFAAGQTNFSRTSMPGIYRVASAQLEKSIAINLDGAESRIVPLPIDEFERLGAPVVMHSKPSDLNPEQKRKLYLQNAELENRQKLWRWLLSVTLIALLVETWLAGRTTRKQALQPQAVP